MYAFFITSLYPLYKNSIKSGTIALTFTKWLEYFDMFIITSIQANYTGTESSLHFLLLLLIIITQRRMELGGFQLSIDTMQCRA